MTVQEERYGPETENLLDLYLPRGSREKPVAVLIHGGGWSGGDKSQSRPRAMRLADSGYVVVAINYRLSSAGHNTFPIPVYDAARALAWVEENISRYGGDPHRIVVSGVSAGAYLAAMLAYAPGQEWLQGTGLAPLRFAPPAAFVGFLGVYDFDATPPDRSGARVFLGDRYARGKWEAASPLHYVSGGSPPALLISGDRDCLINRRDAEGRCDAGTNHSVRLADALRRAGVAARLVTVAGCGHDIACLFRNEAGLAAQVGRFLERSVGPL